MITHIQMQNFKSWKDSREVKLAPLTGFFGTNSSGKSSLLQMLLLLKQTAGRDNIIFFGSDNSLVNLGNFREVIHAHNPQASLGLEFGCKLREPYLMDFSMKDGFQSRSKLDRFTFRTVVCEEEGKLIVESLYYVGSNVRTRIVWDKHGVPDENKPFQDATQLAERDVKNCYGMPTPKKELESEITWNQNFLRQFSSAFEVLFSHIHYLGPTRVHPQRHYHWERTHPKEIDLWGNKAVDALLSARVRQLTIAHNGGSSSIEERISTWLQKMELAHSFQLVPKGSLEDNNYEIRIRKTPNSAEVTLADVGYGVGDLFPLLVHCCYVPEGSTLILEQPGIHLHPMAQAQLADLFLEVIAERNLQILVESHSEHLLTRLQRRIAEKQIDQDDVALYFCRNTDGVSTIEGLEVTESGDIKNWPENFFGDVMGDMFAMTDKQVEQLNDQDPEG